MNQIKTGAALNYITIVLSILVGLIYTPYMLRAMGTSEYGIYSLVASVIAYLTILDLGIGNTIVRYTAKYRAEGKLIEQYNLFGLFFCIYIIIGIITVIAGFFLYENIENIFGKTMLPDEINKSKIMTLILIFNLAITFPMSIYGSIMTAYERFVFPKIISILRLILNTLVMIVLLSWGYKAITMCLVQTFFNVATLLINYIYCKKYLHVKFCYKKFEWGFLKEVSIYSFWIFLNVIMDRIYWSTGQFVLGAVSGTAAVAVYAIAIHMESLYMSFSSSISSVFLPKVTSMVTLRNDKKEISDLFIKTGRIQFSIMGFILTGFIIFGKQFVELWAGKEYSQAYIMTILFYVALLIPLIQSLGITILQARNNMRFRSILYVIIAIVSFCFQITFSKRWGGVGCAIAVSSALILGQGIVMNIYYHISQKIDMVYFWKEILKMSVIPVIFIVLYRFIVSDILSINSWSKLILGMVIFTVLYLPLFYFWGLNQYEKKLANSFIKKLHL